MSLRSHAATVVAGGLVISLLATPSLADPVDGAKAMVCSAGVVYECSEGAACDRILPGEAGAPRFFRIDLANRVAQGAGPGAQGRKSAILSLNEIGGLLVLQGVDQGIEEQRSATGWSASISPADGGFVLVAAGNGGAFVLFGGCLTDE
jgi:hypothetical protein